MSESVTLTIAGAALSGWEEISVSRSLDQAAATFSIAVSERFPAGGSRLPLRPGDACTVALGADTIISGHIDRVEIGATATSHTRRIAGRSRTADLVDASVLDPSGQMKLPGQTAPDILRRLLEPHEVALQFDAEPGAALAHFEIENGERVFDAIDRLLRLRGLQASDTPGGALLVAAPGAQRAQGALALRADGAGNILEARVVADGAERFSEIRVRGQRPGNDQDWGPTVAAVEGRATDQGVSRFRPLVLPAPGAASVADCETVAAWEIARRAGHALEAVYVVQGWRQAETGPLWTVGELVPVRDDLANLDTELVLAAVTYSLGAEGSKTRLVLRPIEAFAPQPALTPESGKGVGGGYWDEIKGGV